MPESPLALFALAALALPLSRRLTGEAFTPPALIVAAWTGTLGLYQWALVPYQPLSAVTWTLLWTVIVVMTVSAAAGMWTGSALGNTVALRPTVPRAPNAWILAYAAAALAGVIWFGVLAVRLIGWNGLRNGWDIRIALVLGTIPSSFLVLEYFCVAAPLLAVALALGGIRLSITAWVAAALATAGTLVTTDRTQFFTVAMTAFFMYVYVRRARLSLARTAAVLAASVLLLVSVFFAIGFWQGKTVRPIAVDVRVPDLPLVPREQELRMRPWVGRAAHFYLYATGSYAGLDALLNDAPMPRTMGLHSVFPIARALQRVGLITVQLPSPIAPFRPIHMTSGPDLPLLNVYTFLYYPYMDFGPRGAVAYAAVVSFLCGVVYAAARRRQSPARILGAAHMATALVLTVFVNKFNNTGWWYVFVLTILPFLVGRRNPVAPEREVPRGSPRRVGEERV